MSMSPMPRKTRISGQHCEIKRLNENGTTPIENRRNIAPRPMNINAGNKNTVRRRPYLIKSAGISIIPNTRRENGHICLILRLITPMSIRKASTAETTAVSPSETQRLLFVKAMAIKKQISPKARRTTGLIIEILLPSNIFLSERQEAEQNLLQELYWNVRFPLSGESQRIFFYRRNFYCLSYISPYETTRK